MTNPTILFQTNQHQKPNLSVIIPFKNSSPTILVALDSLLLQETDFDFEVLFADGHSSDNSVELIRNHPLAAARSITVFYPPEGNDGQMPATNMAAEMARGDIIVLMQADVRVTDPHALTKLRRAFSNEAVVGTFFIGKGAGKEFNDYNFWGQVFLARYQNSHVKQDFDTKFNAIRKSVFQKIGGYDTLKQAWAGGDYDLEMRLVKQGPIVETDIVAWHLHGYGQAYTVKGCIKKYCRNAEASGVTAPIYWRHRKEMPSVSWLLIQQWIICLCCIASLLFPFWPYLLVPPVVLGLYWQKDTFRFVRHWKLIYIPFFGFMLMYLFTFFFLRGFILRKTLYQFDNKVH